MAVRYPTKADARRWWDKREGQEVTTCQVRPDGMVWSVGGRTVTRKGQNHWQLDDSNVRLTNSHAVLHVDADRLVVEWQDDDGTTIHITTYRDVYYDEDDD